MGTTAATLAGLESERTSDVRWFSSQGCVERRDDRVVVMVGGTLVGSFDAKDTASRNVLLVHLAAGPRVHLGHLATAFSVTYETLRELRHQYESEGLAAIVNRRRGGVRGLKVTPSRRAKLEAMFERGHSIDEIVATVGRRWKLGRSTIGTARAAWAARQREQLVSASESAVASTQGELAFEPPTAPGCSPEASSAASASEAPSDEASVAGSSDEVDGDDETIEPREPLSGRFVQHVGAWTLLATVSAMGLHAVAETHRTKRVPSAALRLALDAVILALAIGEACVEGVRRLATPSAPTLLRAARSPAATWVRRVLGRFVREGASAHVHLAMAGQWMRDAAAGEEEAAVFYVDNHLRPYTGQETIRRGWRMQDKKVVPGASDFYVHDEDGRALLRITAPDNPPLTDILSRAAALLRAALGPEQRILLAFDRGGAFPEQMVSLRDEGFEFVTYERRPYTLLSPGAFDEEVEIGGETIRFTDTRKNLRMGRGRVRRIAVRTTDGRQVNILAVSGLAAPRLVEILRGRWVQENAFKHGTERWGINQLDGRQTVSFPPDTVVPNPARRRLDHALRIARAAEGQARVLLARMSPDDPKRGKVEQDVADARARQEELLAQRPSTPVKIELSKSELADALVHHTSEYKLLVDTVRIACANAESELAAIVGTNLHRPAEAKRVLRNLFMAPGRVRVGTRTIAVDIAPAGTATEIEALRALLDELTRRRLRLPGDPRRRRLRLRLQV